MANPATTADLVSRWRTLSAQETTNGQTFLDDAWRMLKRAVLRINEDIEDLIVADTTGDLEDEVIRVLATAVLRVMKNPDGKAREAIDDYSWARDEAVSAGLLYISDAELDGLVPGTGTTGRAYSLDPFAGRDWDDLP